MRTLLFALLIVSGCTAGRASVALLSAQRAVTRAADRGADEHAAYEITMARACLIKAREEASFSSYRTAVELSQEAAGWADKAVIVMENEGTAGPSAAAPSVGASPAVPLAEPEPVLPAEPEPEAP